MSGDRYIVGYIDGDTFIGEMHEPNGLAADRDDALHEVAERNADGYDWHPPFRAYRLVPVDDAEPASDIRAKAIDTLARVDYAAWKESYDQLEGDAGGRHFAPDYDDATRWSARAVAITAATRAVDALAADGLLAQEGSTE